jgi:hypothetical protein
MKYMCISTLCGKYEYKDEYTQGKIYEVISTPFSDRGYRPYFLIINDKGVIGNWREEDLAVCFMELEEWRNKQIDKLI